MMSCFHKYWLPDRVEFKLKISNMYQLFHSNSVKIKKMKDKNYVEYMSQSLYKLKRPVLPTTYEQAKKRLIEIENEIAMNE